MAEAAWAILEYAAEEGAISYATAIATYDFAAAYGSYILLASTMAYSASEARRMQAEAKDAAANAARDRTVTVNGAIVPRDLVLGRARTGGSNFYHAVTGPESSVLYIAQTLAGHEIDAVEQIYVNDVLVTLDANGFVTTAPYGMPDSAVATEIAEADGTVRLPITYTIGSVQSSKVIDYIMDRYGDRPIVEAQPVIVTGSGTGFDPYVVHTTAGATVTYSYVNSATGSLRFAVHLGGDDQTVDPWLHAAFSDWLSTYTVKGVAYIVARLNYDTNAFPSSVPSISALVRGAKVIDPRGAATTFYGTGVNYHTIAYPSTAYNIDNGAFEINLLVNIASVLGTQTLFSRSNNTSAIHLQVTNGRPKLVLQDATGTQTIMQTAPQSSGDLSYVQQINTVEQAGVLKIAANSTDIYTIEYSSFYSIVVRSVGQSTPKQTIADNTCTYFLELSPDNSKLYAGGMGQINVYLIGTNGMLLVSSASILANLPYGYYFHVKILKNNKFLYTNAQIGNYNYIYIVDLINNTIIQNIVINASSGIALSYDNAHLYVIDRINNILNIYQVNTTTGFISNAPVQVININCRYQGIINIDASPINGYVYISAEISDAPYDYVSAYFQNQATGNLEFVSSADLTVSNPPLKLKVSENGLYLYLIYQNVYYIQILECSSGVLTHHSFYNVSSGASFGDITQHGLKVYASALYDGSGFYEFDIALGDTYYEISAGDWTQLQVSGNSVGHIALLLDGVTVVSTDTTWALSFAASDPVILGAQLSGAIASNFFSGAITSATISTAGTSANMLESATAAWSDNPALLMRHVYSHARLGGATVSADEDARFAVAAAACKIPTVYTIDGVEQPTRPLFTAGGVWRFDGGAPSNILNDLAQAMGGSWAFAGGELYLRAGVYTAPVMTLTDADLAVVQRTGTTETQSPIEVSVHRATADMVNTIKPIIYDAANDYKQTDLPEISSTALITRDGSVLSQSVQMSCIDYAPQAQHVAGIIIRDGRDPLSVKAPFKMRAYSLEMFDTVTLQLTELGIDGTFLVVGRSFIQGVVNLTLKETAAQITTVDADFRPGGYAINSNLPKPWEVATMGLLSVSSGTQWLRIAGDGTIQSQMHITWPTVTDVSVIQGGSIELQYRLGTAAEWTSLTIPGDSADALIGPVTDGNHYLLRARLCSSIFKGKWSKLAGHTVIGKTEPPPAFDIFLIKAQPDGTRQYNFAYTTTATPPDWMGAEIRYTTGTIAAPDWASMTPLQDGTSYYTHSPVELNAPQAGAYTFACRSLDTTGNESAAIVHTITLPDRRLANVFDFYDERDEGWPGTLDGCFVSGTALEAIDTTTWDTTPATWGEWTRWNLHPTSPITYTSPVRDLGIVIAANFDVSLIVDGSYTQQLRISQDNITWGEWGSADGAFTARYLQWRITVAATADAPVPCVRAARYQIAAPLKQEYLNDIDISTLPAPYRIGVGDVRIPLAGSYIIIKRNSPPVVQDNRAGQWTTALIDKDLSPGPRWQFRLDGVLTDPAFVDFFIEAF